MDAFDTLTASYFDGSLTERDAAELAHVLDHDVEKAARFVGDYEIHRLLALRAAPVDESRIDAILAQIQQENDPFVRSVFEAIENKAATPVAAVQSWRHWVAQLFSRPGWALLAAACVVFLWSAWFFYHGIAVGEPRLELAENSLVDLVRNGVLTRAQHGFALRTGDVLSVPGTNSATISYAPEKTRITIRPGTGLKLVSVSSAKRFVLSAGKLEASVTRQRPFRAMVIVTPQAEARVLGTEFTLAVKTNSTRLEVTEGKVRLTSASDGSAVKVIARQYTVAAPNYVLAALPQTGTILYEYWTNVPSLWDPTWDSKLEAHPAGVEDLALFEAAGKSGDNFGERIRGYLHPPKTGDYTFWIAGDGAARFLLSRDDQPRNRVWIATAAETKKSPREWTNQGKQQSSAITLTAGHMYYIEAIQNDAGKGEHHLAVAWQGPDREREVIPGEFLSPFETQTKEKK